jgi:NAD(P)-dependent dehydrogenase (short-subunit alcohol dehydrogenase family)
VTMSLVDLSGRHALVTGAAGGLGRAVATTMAAVGARITALDVNADGAAETAEEIRAAGGTAQAIRCDVTDPASIVAAIDQASADGPADILVNNAGINPRGGSLTTTDEIWAKTFAVNLEGYYHCARRFAELLIEAGRGGSIVCVSSTGGNTSLGRGNFVYGISKAGVQQMTRELAVVWAQYNIRVNTVAPCQIETEGLLELSRRPSSEGHLYDTFMRGIPLHRLAKPSEIANAITFLASEAASMITGVVLPVDGGNLALNAAGTIGEP